METFGKYQLTTRLGQGGMAEVFKARQVSGTGVAKQLVVKRILPMLSEHAAFRSMFLDEARLSTQLSHGNVVQVFDAGEVDGRLFIAMELVDGVGLDQVLVRARSREIRLPPVVAVLIAIEALKGLHHAHTRQGDDGRLLRIVHRDISPDNLLVGFEGQVKVNDFGIAKAALEGRAETRSGVFKGKLIYGAPEQIRGEAVDARADVFSLGVVLYEALSGGNPIGTRAVELALSGAELPRLGTMFLGEQLPEIIARATASRPEHRYPSALAFQQALTEWMLPRAGSHAATGISSLMAWLFPAEVAARGLSVTLETDTARWLESNPAAGPGTAEVRPSDPLADTAISGGHPAVAAKVTPVTPAPEKPVAPPEPDAPRGTGRTLRAVALVSAVGLAIPFGIYFGLRKLAAEDDRAAIAEARQAFEHRQLPNAHSVLLPLMVRSQPSAEAIALDNEIVAESDASVAITETWVQLDIAASKHRPLDPTALDALLKRAHATHRFQHDVDALEACRQAVHEVAAEALAEALAAVKLGNLEAVRSALPCPAAATVCDDTWYRAQLVIEQRSRDALDQAEALEKSNHLHEARLAIETADQTIYQAVRLSRVQQLLAVTSSEEELEKLITQAISHHDWNQIDQLLNECATGIRVCADSPSIAQRIGDERAFTADVERAERALAEGNGRRARDYLNYAGQTYYQARRLEDDSRALRDWLAHHPLKPPCDAPGDAALLRKDYESARDLLEPCIVADPKDYDAWRLLGDVRRLSRSGEDPAEAYLHYLEFAPSHDPAREAVSAALSRLSPASREEEKASTQDVVRSVHQRVKAPSSSK